MIVRIAQTAVRHRRVVIAGWLVVIVIGLGLSTGLVNRLDPLAHGDSRKEAIKGGDVLKRVTGTSGEVVALVDDIDIADPTTKQRIEAGSADVRAIPGVVTAFDYYSTNNPALVATDKRATLLVTYVASSLSDGAERDVVKARRQALRGGRRQRAYRRHPRGGRSVPYGRRERPAARGVDRVAHRTHRDGADIRRLARCRAAPFDRFRQHRLVDHPLAVRDDVHERLGLRDQCGIDARSRSRHRLRIAHRQSIQRRARRWSRPARRHRPRAEQRRTHRVLLRR